MGTPFAPRPTITDVVIPATDAQITRALVPMLAQRDWRTASNASYVSRTAILNLMLKWALAPMADETPAEVSRVLNGMVGRNAPYGQRVNVLLSWSAEYAAEGKADLYAPLTKAGATKLISALTELPLVDTALDAPKPAAVADEPAVPAGRYAIDTQEGAINLTAFYKVDHGKGRWAGRTFVDRLVGPDKVAVKGRAAQTILAAIAVDPRAASIRYGLEIEECGLCGTRLTNDESRKAGIGPDCRKKLGW